MRYLWYTAAALTVVSGQSAAQTPPPPRPIGPLTGVGKVGMNPAVPIVDGMDLLPITIALDATNHVGYTMMNAGRSPVTQPFVADIYVNGVRRDTYKHTGQGAQSQVPVLSSLARVDSCGAVVIKVVADAQQVIAEANETNNTTEATITPRCPDLAITSIKQDWQDANTRYRIQVTVQNQGNLAVPKKVQIRGWGGPEGALSGLDPTAWPIFTDSELDPLAPGQSTTFHIGNVFLGTTTVLVKIALDAAHTIQEKRIDNNVATKTLGPH
jgi:subtilase family serine protease